MDKYKLDKLLSELDDHEVKSLLESPEIFIEFLKNSEEESRDEEDDVLEGMDNNRMMEANQFSESPINSNLMHKIDGKLSFIICINRKSR